MSAFSSDVDGFDENVVCNLSLKGQVEMFPSGKIEVVSFVPAYVLAFQFDFETFIFRRKK